jgi:hypothetical protein
MPGVSGRRSNTSSWQAASGARAWGARLSRLWMSVPAGSLPPAVCGWMLRVI